MEVQEQGMYFYYLYVSYKNMYFCILYNLSIKGGFLLDIFSFKIN